MVQEFYNRLRERLGPASMRQVHVLLHSAFKLAAKWRLIPYNPATYTVRPSPQKQKIMRAMTLEQSLAFIRETYAHRYGYVLRFLLVTGVRPEEAFALQWADIDFEKCEVSITKALIRPRKGGGWYFDSPKTSSSNRKITIDPRDVDDLIEWRKIQLVERQFAGKKWLESYDFVFTSNRGTTWRSHARAHLNYWKPDRDLTTLSRLEVQAWVNWRARTGVKPSTIGHEFCFLKRLWRVLEDRGLDAGLQFPMQRVRLPKKRTDKRQIKAEVVEELSALMSEDDWDLVNFTQMTMLRRLEVFRLCPQHILEDRDENGNLRYKVRVIISKTGRARTVPLNEEAAEIALRRVRVCRDQRECPLIYAQRLNLFFKNGV